MKYFKRFLGLTALVAAVSCAKSPVEGNGTVSFSLDCDHEVAEQTKSSVADYTVLPSSADFAITVKDASSSVFWSGKVSEWDAATQVPAGEYSVEASYGAIDVEGFDKPFFYGSETFTVEGGQAASVSVNVSLGNTVILVDCTENFNNYYNDYTFELVRDGSSIATFVKGEDKAAFIDGYKVTLKGTVTGSNGKQQSFTKDYTGLKEATAYTILFDASNVGGSSITITFDNTVEIIDLGDVELND
jgi:hypothetical protein